MPEFLIQVQEDEAWLKVTTVRYETGHADQKGNRRRAMRLAEPVGYEKFRVISGVGQ